MKRVLEEAALHKTIVFVIFCKRYFVFLLRPGLVNHWYVFSAITKLLFWQLRWGMAPKNVLTMTWSFLHTTICKAHRKNFQYKHHNFLPDYCFMWSKPRKETILIVLVGICFVFFIRFQLLFLEFASRSSDDKSDNIILFVKRFLLLVKQIKQDTNDKFKEIPLVCKMLSYLSLVVQFQKPLFQSSLPKI